MVQQVFIVRHGETDYNAQHRWQGQIDVPLNSLGLEQAKKLSQYFTDISIDVIFSSDLRRAYDTALAIAAPKQLEVIIEPRLREISVGSFEGLTRPEIMTQFPKELEAWDNNETVAPPNGESRVQVQERAYKVWQELIMFEDYGTIMLLSHGAFIRMLIKKLMPTEFETLKHIANTSISLLEKQDNLWKAVFLNETPHLK